MSTVKKIAAYALSALFIYLPSAIAEEKKEGAWFPFYIPWNYCEGSRVDFSFLLDGPAGKYGFLESRDGHFYFKNGRRAKFWGVNIHSNKACFPSHKQAEDAAKRLAQLGCNIVRMHFLDNEAPGGIIDPNYKDSQHFSTSQMEKLDYFIYQLKGRGIYVTFDVLGLGVRKFKSGDGVADYNNIKEGAGGISFFDKRIIELSKKFAVDFLSHKNPYTGNSYLDEPAIAMIEMTNENTLFADWIIAHFTPYYKDEIKNIWVKWLKDKGLAPDGDWFSDRRFMFEIEDKYKIEMYEYLRSIGVKCLIGASNTPYDNLALLADSHTDFTDIHPYWDLVYRSDRVHNRPLIKQSCFNGHTMVNIMASAKVKGRPLMITEWGSVWPNEWRAVDMLTTASYAALNDADGLFLYAYNGGWGMSWDNLEKKLYHDTVVFNDPAKMGLFPLCALIFTGDSVTPSSNTVRVSYKLDELFKMKDSFPDRVLLTGIAYVSKLEKIFEPDKNETSDRAGIEYPNVSDLIKDRNRALSDTKEISRDSEKGIFILNTPKVFSFSGFIGGEPAQEFHGIRISYNVGEGLKPSPTKSDFATFTIASLDEKDIAESRHLLLAVVGRARNTGQKISPHPAKKVDDMESDIYILYKGKGPILAEGIEGDIFIKKSSTGEGVEIFCLDEKGLRKSSIQPEKKGDGFLFKISTAKDATMYYEIIKE